jgi:hypothetical protein
LTSQNNLENKNTLAICPSLPEAQSTPELGRPTGLFNQQDESLKNSW